MEKKIREYVEYQLRFDNSPNRQDKIDEIVSNTIERYYELLEKYNDEEKAFKESVKKIVEFQSEDNITTNRKAAWFDSFFVVSVILSILSTFTIFLNSIVALVILTTSLSLYGAASVYVIKQADYYKNNEFDIAKHHDALNTVFRYMKTCFIFWSISISILLTVMIVCIVQQLTVLGFISTSSISVSLYISIIIISFIISAILCVLLSITLYKKLMNYYYKETGNTYLKSYISSAADIIKDKDNKQESLGFDEIFKIIILIATPILILLCFLLSASTEVSFNVINDLGYTYQEVRIYKSLINYDNYSPIIPLIPLFALGLYALAIIKKNYKIYFYIGLYLFATYLSFFTCIAVDEIFIDGLFVWIFPLIIIYLIFVIISLIKLNKCLINDFLKPTIIATEFATAIITCVYYLNTLIGNKELYLVINSPYMLIPLACIVLDIILIIIHIIKKHNFISILVFLVNIIGGTVIYITNYVKNPFCMINIIINLVLLILMIIVLIILKVRKPKVVTTSNL